MGGDADETTDFWLNDHGGRKLDAVGYGECWF
jgi:hypothetical protein